MPLGTNWPVKAYRLSNTRLSIDVSLLVYFVSNLPLTVHLGQYELD
jgi:hypothetical protein